MYVRMRLQCTNLYQHTHYTYMNLEGLLTNELRYHHHKQEHVNQGRSFELPITRHTGA